MTATVETKPPEIYPGFNVLLMGESGAGKTASLASLVDTGLETFCLFLEPGLETLIGMYVDKKKPIPPNLHWHYFQPPAHGFSDLKKAADSVGKFDLSTLLKSRDIDRGKNNPLIPMYESLNNFSDHRTGKAFGAIDTWSTEAVFVIDSLSALNSIVKRTVTGTRPAMDQGDWGLSQNLLMPLIDKLTNGCICHFVLIGHIERETDLVLGGSKITICSPGRALASQIPRNFSDVILAERLGTEFIWNTAHSQAALKTRNLPIATKLPADFGQIYNKWKSRREVALLT